MEWGVDDKIVKFHPDARYKRRPTEKEFRVGFFLRRMKNALQNKKLFYHYDKTWWIENTDGYLSKVFFEGGKALQLVLLLNKVVEEGKPNKVVDGIYFSPDRKIKCVTVSTSIGYEISSLHTHLVKYGCCRQKPVSWWKDALREVFVSEWWKEIDTGAATLVKDFLNLKNSWDDRWGEQKNGIITQVKDSFPKYHDFTVVRSKLQKFHEAFGKNDDWWRHETKVFFSPSLLFPDNPLAVEVVASINLVVNKTKEMTISKKKNMTIVDARALGYDLPEIVVEKGHAIYDLQQHLCRVSINYEIRTEIQKRKKDYKNWSSCIKN